MRKAICLAAIVIVSSSGIHVFGQRAARFKKSYVPKSRAAAGTMYGDLDGDLDVDLNDYVSLALCLSNSGPGVPAATGCLELSADGDLTIDLVDVAAFQIAFTSEAPPVCGNGKLETGEECDDGNNVNGDGCNASCQTEVSTVVNDFCSAAITIGDGALVFSNAGAGTDGPAEPLDCLYFGSDQIESDIWYCYTATCTGPATASLCGSEFDTRLAVYAGCGCPSARPLACSDDDCGAMAETYQSRVQFDAVAGQSYMVRVGGYSGTDEEGDGRLTVRCGQDTCESGTGSCTAGHAEGEAGCDDPACCNSVCAVDQFCCDVTWNSFCAAEAGGYCDPAGFPSCLTSTRPCGNSHNTPGCEDVDCCNAVCNAHPICCIDKWDNECTLVHDLLCANCGAGRGPCDEAREGPGCEDVSCCGKVCAVDAFCCFQQWDVVCAQQAGLLCGP